MVVTIRSARQDDLAALTAIYNHYVEQTHVTFDLEPFTVDQRQPWFDHYSATGRHRLFVAEADAEVVGYATSGPFRDKPAYLPSVETTVYCRPDRAGRGVGSALYGALFAALADEDVHRAFAGIALPNDASLALHHSFGFTEVGTFREVGRKFGTWWDVTWLSRNVG